MASFEMIGGKPYKTYADLRGRTIGTQTLTSGTGFRFAPSVKGPWFRISGDYALLNIGGPADRYQALTSGQISRRLSGAARSRRQQQG